MSRLDQAMKMHVLIVSLLAALTLSSAAQAHAPGRRIAVTFDDLPYQASETALCDPAELMRLTTDFVASRLTIRTCIFLA